MTPQELTDIIDAELESASDPPGWRGRPLRECLLKPEKHCFLNSHNGNEPENLWLVFEEGPKSGEGYKIVYDEELNLFGLAVDGTHDSVLMGLYGSFLETLNSM